MIGVSDDMVREVAQAEGFQWVGYGGRNNQTLEFQRSHGAEPKPRFDAASPDERVLAQLQVVEPDLGGMARIEVTGFRKGGPLGSLDDLVDAHGWVFDRTERSGSTVYAILGRPGAPAVDRHDPLFVNGPSLAALRQNDDAVREARKVVEELGIDPLSDAVLERVRSEHVRLRGKFLKWGWFAALFGTALIIVLLVLGRAAQHDWPSTPALGISAIVLAVGLGLCSVPAARWERARRGAVKDYKAGYERVAAAAFGRTREGRRTQE